MSARDEQSGLILLVEDNRQIAEMVGEFLERRGYSVDYAADGVSGLHLAVSNSYDVVVLDLMLPGMDGLDVCRKLRRDAKKSTPVLMLTARDTLEDKLVGLEAGADDYLVKPFDLDELLARLRALIRRRDGRTESVIRCGDVEVDPSAMVARKGSAQVHTTAKEFHLLKLLMERSGRYVTKNDIEYALYDAENTVESNTIEVTIYNLRKKLGTDFIKSIRGVGYMIER